MSSKPMSGTMRLTYGTLANGVSQVVNIATQLGLVPLYLSCWGSTRYGMWLALSAAVSYLGMLDGGIQTFVVNELTKLRASRDHQAYSKILNSALILVGVVSAGGALMALTLSAALPIERWMRVSEIGLRPAVGLLALQVIGSLPLGLVSGVYRTTGDYAREQMISNARRVLTFLMTVVVLATGGGFVALAGVQLAALVASSAYVLHDLSRRYSWLTFDWDDADRHTALSLVGPSSYFLLMQLWGGVAHQGSTLLVGSIQGPTAVAVFVSLRTLVNFIKQLAGAAQNALWPELTALEARGRIRTLRNVHMATAKLLMLLWAGAAVFLYLEGADVVKFWTAGRLPYDGGIMLALVVLLGGQSFWSTSAVLMSATNNHRKIAICVIASGVAGLVIGYELGLVAGTPGVIYGMAIADFFICGYYVPRMACRQMEQRFRVFVTEVLGRGTLVLFVLILSALALNPLIQHIASFPRMLAWAAYLGLIAAIASYRVLLNADERNWLAVKITAFRTKPSTTMAR